MSQTLTLCWVFFAIGRTQPIEFLYGVGIGFGIVSLSDLYLEMKLSDSIRLDLDLDLKNLSPFISLVKSRGGHGSGVPESTPEGFCVFLADLDSEPESIN